MSCPGAWLVALNPPKREPAVLWANKAKDPVPVSPTLSPLRRPPLQRVESNSRPLVHPTNETELQA